MDGRIDELDLQVLMSVLRVKMNRRCGVEKSFVSKPEIVRPKSGSQAI